MKRFATILLFLSLQLFAQGQFWNWQNPKPTGQDLNDAIVFADGKIVTFLTGGLVQITTDNGTNWTTVIADTNREDIYEADFPTPTTGYLCGSGGLIMKTTDGGLSWNYQNSGVTVTLWYLDFYDANLGLAIGATGNILRTTDGGATWTPSTSPGSTTLYNVQFVDASTVYMTAGSTTIGRLFKSTDGGVTFTNISANVPFVGTSTVRGLYFHGQTHGWLTTTLYEVYRTTDGGTTWALTQDLGTGTLYEVRFADTLNGFMAGTNGEVFRSTDGGVTWALQAMNATENMYGLDIAPVLGEGSLRTVIACGRYGTLLKSADYGTTWHKLYSAATQEELRDVTFVDPLVGYAVGGPAVVGPGNGQVLKTTDGGNTWNQIAGTTYRNYSAFWHDANNGYVGYRSPWGIWKTTNGGTSWDSLNTGLGAATGIWYYIHFSSPTNGFIAGSSGIAGRTTDGGATWTASTTNFSTSVIYGGDYIDANKYIIVGSSGKYGISTDGGATFTQAVLPGTTAAQYDVDFIDANTGWVVGSSGNIRKTTDGGATWTTQTSGSLSTLYSVRAINANTVWVGGSGGTILYTVDGGNTWLPGRQALGAITTTYSIAEKGGYIWLAGTGGMILQGFADPNVPVELASFSASVSGSTVNLAWETATETNNLGFYVEMSSDSENWIEKGFVAGAGTSTSINRYSFSLNVTGGNSLWFRLRQTDLDGSASYSNKIEVSFNPVEFSLSQNYPNPFNPSTTINFTLPAASQVTLDVFNVAGEKVATLVNGQMVQGFHSVNFDASKLSSGIYLYTIKAGSFTATRKMILMK